MVSGEKPLPREKLCVESLVMILELSIDHVDMDGLALVIGASNKTCAGE